MDNNRVFIQNSNLKDKITCLKDNLKRHLSSEYLYLSERKEDLDSRVAHLKLEREQKNKTLFQTQEKFNKKKYFTPLNLTDFDHEEYDERKKQMDTEILRIEAEIGNVSQKMEEVKKFISDIDQLLGTEFDQLFSEYQKEKESKKGI
ncbi:MAG: hypothetical protein U0K57_09550 [Lachnospiraceae bacterium]|nr:hypothetical protein [Lachnospiraceae bacterium]